MWGPGDPGPSLTAEKKILFPLTISSYLMRISFKQDGNTVAFHLLYTVTNVDRTLTSTSPYLSDPKLVYSNFCF